MVAITIQFDLKWSNHINEIQLKANRSLSLIKRNLKLVNKSVKETAYFVLVRSQLEFASTVWSPWLAKDIFELEKIQRRAARYVVNNYDFTNSVTEMIERLGWESLEDRRTKSRLCLFFKIMSEQICIPRNEIIPSDNLYTTRSSHHRNVITPYARTDVYKYSFFPFTCQKWNNLPSTTKDLQSLDTFRKNI